MSELRRRLLAGIWFAIAGAIPVVIYFSFLWEGDRTHFNAVTILLAIGTPVLMAGISGFSLGYGILDPGEIKSTGQAMVRGLLVALLSYLFFFIASALILAVMNNDESGFIIAWAVIFLYGFLYVGWLITMVGLVAGLLLYQYRIKRLDYQYPK
jgi:hypothetical protein